MIFADTHTHLYLEEFEGDRDAMMGRAMEAGVRYFFLPNIDSGSVAGMLQLAAGYPGVCFPMAGLHPTSVKDDFAVQLEEIGQLRYRAGITGIGECGIDLYWDKTHRAAQRSVFITQLQWSLEMGLPVSIHIRDAFDAVFEALDSFGDTKFNGVFHCFTGGMEEAQRAISKGFVLGIGGIVTFRNSHLQGLLKEISPDHVVLESDAPFLAPVPFRGKRNEPAYLPFVAEKLAGLWGTTTAGAAEITTANALRVFKFNHS